MKPYHFTPSGDLRYGPRTRAIDLIRWVVWLIRTRRSERRQRKTDQPRSERSDMVGVMAWMLVAVAVWSVLVVRAVWV